MATVQIVRNAETITKTAIDQKQSLEVVQTMLHGGLSSLSFLRFFAEKAFDEQVYEMSDKIHSYEDYAAGKLTRNRNLAKKPSTAMRVLRRGRSKRADMFLDWLELGAFAALKAGHLQALQVFVHADPEDRTKVLETYTFTIKYDHHDGHPKALAGLEIDSPGSPLVSVEATNSALQSLLRQVMDICADLPDLPERRYISMELLYIPDAEMKYKPDGFQPSKIEQLRFAGAEGWEKRSTMLEQLSSSFHRSTLKVSALVQSSKRHYASFFTPTLPRELQYDTGFSKLEEVGIADSDARVTEVTEEPPKSGSAAETVTPSTVIEDGGGPPIKSELGPKPARVGTIITPAPTSEPVQPVQFSDESASAGVDAMSVDAAKPSPADEPQPGDSYDTQTSNMFGMKSAFTDMMQPEEITQGDTQTQSMMRQPPTTESETTASPSRLTVSPSKTIPTQPAASDKALLSPTKAKELARNKSRLRKHALELVKRAGGKIKKRDIVLCQCGHDKEEDDMVECTYCGTWQHLPCYGYTSGEDPRLPDEHTCYQCLLGDEEKLTLTKLQELSMRRRAMDFALQHGLKTQKNFTEDLELNSATGRQLFNYLKTSGFVVDAAGARKAGYAATGKPLLVAVRSGPKHDLMLQMLFDPLFHIRHHYHEPRKPVTQPSTLTQRLLQSQAIDMPPPATPASELRKRSAMSPASGLDLRASMTPFQTPSRPRAPQTRPQKRALEDHAGHARSPKRPATPSSVYKRMRSMQSRFVIDANGLPSSPVDHHTLR